MESSKRCSTLWLETERLVLRPMSEEDADLVVKWRNSRRISSETLQASDVLLTVEDHLSWFRRTRSSRLDYIMVTKDGEVPIGCLSFRFVELKGFGLCGESGRYIGEETYLGNGYASEAAARWLKFGFYDLSLDCVVGRTRCSNVANIRMNKRLGYRFHAWPDEFGSVSEEWCFMYLTREEWFRVDKSDAGG
ncbi:GNAT family N-acetyltransferase [Thioalkalivibrio sp. ALE31]|uniref:GNAT family N-acetyltransferase n=1 Tax=Thioalkalivibrio sp. ALE31 TaxID=1158182 RepID=UPI0009D9C615